MLTNGSRIRQTSLKYEVGRTGQRDRTMLPLIKDKVSLHDVVPGRDAARAKVRA
jgi:hypothetical protein